MSDWLRLHWEFWLTQTGTLDLNLKLTTIVWSLWTKKSHWTSKLGAICRCVPFNISAGVPFVDHTLKQGSNLHANDILYLSLRPCVFYTRVSIIISWGRFGAAIVSTVSLFIRSGVRNRGWTSLTSLWIICHLHLKGRSAEFKRR